MSPFRENLWKRRPFKKRDSLLHNNIQINTYIKPHTYTRYIQDVVIIKPREESLLCGAHCRGPGRRIKSDRPRTNTPSMTTHPAPRCLLSLVASLLLLCEQQQYRREKEKNRYKPIQINPFNCSLLAIETTNRACLLCTTICNSHLDAI